MSAAVAYLRRHLDGAFERGWVILQRKIRRVRRRRRREGVIARLADDPLIRRPDPNHPDYRESLHA